MDATSLLIVPVGADVVEALALVHAAAFDAPWSAADLGEVLASPFVFGLQAKSSPPASPPLGFILARAVAGEAEILTLAVDPAARRRGVGGALVEAAAGVALGAGAQTMWLEVAQDNASALALYASSGFKEVGRRPRYYPRADGAVDALTLRRRLNSGPA